MPRRATKRGAWSRRFVPAIPLPGGSQLATLSDARGYILDLPPDTQHSAPWQAAVEALLLVASNGGQPEMFARIGMMQALYPNTAGE